jgi:protein-arginine kinase
VKLAQKIIQFTVNSVMYPSQADLTRVLCLSNQTSTGKSGNDLSFDKFPSTASSDTVNS